MGAWVKRDRPSETVIISAGDEAGLSYSRMQLRLSRRYVAASYHGHEVRREISPPYDQWFHLAATIDELGEVRIFLDGQELTQYYQTIYGPYIPATEPVPPISEVRQIAVGMPVGASSRDLSGSTYIDKPVLLPGVILSDDEIKAYAQDQNHFFLTIKISNGADSLFFNNGYPTSLVLGDETRLSTSSLHVRLPSYAHSEPTTEPDIALTTGSEGITQSASSVIETGVTSQYDYPKPSTTTIPATLATTTQGITAVDNLAGTEVPTTGVPIILPETAPVFRSIQSLYAEWLEDGVYHRENFNNLEDPAISLINDGAIKQYELRNGNFKVRTSSADDVIRFYGKEARLTYQFPPWGGQDRILLAYKYSEHFSVLSRGMASVQLLDPRGLDAFIVRGMVPYNFKPDQPQYYQPGVMITDNFLGDDPEHLNNQVILTSSADRMVSHTRQWFEGPVTMSLFVESGHITDESVVFMSVHGDLVTDRLTLALDTGYLVVSHGSHSQKYRIYNLLIGQLTLTLDESGQMTLYENKSPYPLYSETGHPQRPVAGYKTVTVGTPEFASCHFFRATSMFQLDDVGVLPDIALSADEVQDLNNNVGVFIKHKYENSGVRVLGGFPRYLEDVNGIRKPITDFIPELRIYTDKMLPVSIWPIKWQVTHRLDYELGVRNTIYNDKDIPRTLVVLDGAHDLKLGIADDTLYLSSASQVSYQFLRGDGKDVIHAYGRTWEKPEVLPVLKLPDHTPENTNIVLVHPFLFDSALSSRPVVSNFLKPSSPGLLLGLPGNQALEVSAPGHYAEALLYRLTPPFTAGASIRLPPGSLRATAGILGLHIPTSADTTFQGFEAYLDNGKLIVHHIDHKVELPHGLRVGQWQQLSFTLDRQGEIGIYLNGEQLNTEGAADIVVTGQPTPQTSPVDLHGFKVGNFYDRWMASGTVQIDNPFAVETLLNSAQLSNLAESANGITTWIWFNDGPEQLTISGGFPEQLEFKDGSLSQLADSYPVLKIYNDALWVVDNVFYSGELRQKLTGSVNSGSLTLFSGQFDISLSSGCSNIETYVHPRVTSFVYEHPRRDTIDNIRIHAGMDDQYDRFPDNLYLLSGQFQRMRLPDADSLDDIYLGVVYPLIYDGRDSVDSLSASDSASLVAGRHKNPDYPLLSQALEVDQPGDVAQLAQPRTLTLPMMASVWLRILEEPVHSVIMSAINSETQMGYEVWLEGNSFYARMGDYVIKRDWTPPKNEWFSFHTAFYEESMHITLDGVYGYIHENEHVSGSSFNPGALAVNVTFGMPESSNRAFSGALLIDQPVLFSGSSPTIDFPVDLRLSSGSIYSTVHYKEAGVLNVHNGFPFEVETKYGNRTRLDELYPGLHPYYQLLVEDEKNTTAEALVTTQILTTDRPEWLALQSLKNKALWSIDGNEHSAFPDSVEDSTISLTGVGPARRYELKEGDFHIRTGGGDDLIILHAPDARLSYQFHPWEGQDKINIATAASEPVSSTSRSLNTIQLMDTEGLSEYIIRTFVPFHFKPDEEQFYEEGTLVSKTFSGNSEQYYHQFSVDTNADRLISPIRRWYQGPMTLVTQVDVFDTNTRTHLMSVYGDLASDRLDLAVEAGYILVSHGYHQQKYAYHWPSGGHARLAVSLTQTGELSLNVNGQEMTPEEETGIPGIPSPAYKTVVIGAPDYAALHARGGFTVSDAGVLADLALSSADLVDLQESRDYIITYIRHRHNDYGITIPSGYPQFLENLNGERTAIVDLVPELYRFTKNNPPDDLWVRGGYIVKGQGTAENDYEGHLTRDNVVALEGSYALRLKEEDDLLSIAPSAKISYQFSRGDGRDIIQPYGNTWEKPVILSALELPDYSQADTMLTMVHPFIYDEALSTRSKAANFLLTPTDYNLLSDLPNAPALEINAHNQYAKAKSFRLPPPFTTGAQVRLPPGNLKATAGILGMKVPVYPFYWLVHDWMLEFNGFIAYLDNGKLIVRHIDHQIEVPHGLCVGQWHHLCFTLDNQGEINIYRDGVLLNVAGAADVTITGQPTPHIQSSSPDEFWVGNFYDHWTASGTIQISAPFAIGMLLDPIQIYHLTQSSNGIMTWINFDQGADQIVIAGGFPEQIEFSDGSVTHLADSYPVLAMYRDAVWCWAMSFMVETCSR